MNVLLTSPMKVRKDIEFVVSQNTREKYERNVGCEARQLCANDAFRVGENVALSSMTSRQTFARVDIPVKRRATIHRNEKAKAVARSKPEQKDEYFRIWVFCNVHTQKKDQEKVRLDTCLLPNEQKQPNLAQIDDLDSRISI